MHGLHGVRLRCWFLRARARIAIARISYDNLGVMVSVCHNPQWRRQLFMSGEAKGARHV